MVKEAANARPPTWPIGSVSALLGIPVPTIRSWERRYGFPLPRKTDGLHRRYSENDIASLRSIRDEIVIGHSAREAVIRVRDGMGRGGSTLWADRIVRAATQIDPLAVRAGLDAATEAVGVENAIRDVAMPVLRRMGDSWKTGACDVAHEHVATEGIRGWLVRCGGMAPMPFRSRAVVLACGEQDRHTVALEAFGVILQRRGWHVVMLGSVPPSALVATVRSVGARAVVVTSQQRLARKAAVAMLTAALSLGDRQLRTYYAGNAFTAASARRGAPGLFLGLDICAAASIVDDDIA